MKHVYVRFCAERNDFLAQARRQTTFDCALRGRVAVKDLIESLGVTHTEVDLILTTSVALSGGSGA